MTKETTTTKEDWIQYYMLYGYDFTRAVELAEEKMKASDNE